MPLVSIVVPVYNTEQYLKECLDSLSHQTLEDIEIICVNDGSKDSSLTILEDYACQDKRIKIINQENRGVSEARNVGLDLVQGQYFMFVDSDDWIDTRTCAKMYSVARTSDADCVMCPYVKEFSDHSVISHIFEEQFFEWDKDEVREGIYRRLFGPIGSELRHPESMDILVSSWMQLFKTEKFRNVRFFDIWEIGTFEDGLYQMEIYCHCEKFVYIGEPFYHYRKTNEESITTVYKEGFEEKWMRLFDLINEKIDTNHLGAEYTQALNNRVCISMIGLGLNQIKSKESLFSDAKVLNNILNTSRFSNAFSYLKTDNFPLHWKCFFALCKTKSTFLLVILLELIETLRKRIR